MRLNKTKLLGNTWTLHCSKWLSE